MPVQCFSFLQNFLFQSAFVPVSSLHSLQKLDRYLYTVSLNFMFHTLLLFVFFLIPLRSLLCEFASCSLSVYNQPRIREFGFVLFCFGVVVTIQDWLMARLRKCLPYEHEDPSSTPVLTKSQQRQPGYGPVHLLPQHWCGAETEDVSWGAHWAASVTNSWSKFQVH